MKRFLSLAVRCIRPAQHIPPRAGLPRRARRAVVRAVPRLCGKTPQFLDCCLPRRKLTDKLSVSVVLDHPTFVRCHPGIIAVPSPAVRRVMWRLAETRRAQWLLDRAASIASDQLSTKRVVGNGAGSGRRVHVRCTSAQRSATRKITSSQPPDLATASACCLNSGCPAAHSASSSRLSAAF